MAMLHLFRWCLSTCMILQLHICPMVNAKVGNVSLSDQSSNHSEVQTLFSTVTLSAHEDQVSSAADEDQISSTSLEDQISSTSLTPALFTDELSSTSTLNSLNLFSSSVTTDAVDNTAVVSTNDVITTSSVSHSSISDDSLVSVNSTVVTTDDYGPSGISLSSRVSSVQSDSLSTYSVEEVVSTTSVVTSQLINELNTSTNETSTDLLNAQNTINATATYTIADISAAVTSFDHLNSTAADDTTLQSSVADVSSSNILELSTSIMPTTPTLSEIINISTTNTLADRAVTPSSSRVVPSVESTPVFQTDVSSYSTLLFNQTELDQSEPALTTITTSAIIDTRSDFINSTSGVVSPTLSSSTVSETFSTDHGYSDTGDRENSSSIAPTSSSIVTTSIDLPLSSKMTTSSHIEPTSSLIMAMSSSIVTTSSPIETTSDSIKPVSSPTAASETLTSSSSLLTFNTTTSVTPDIHPNIRSSVSPSISEPTPDTGTTTSVSTETTPDVSDIFGSLFTTNTVSSIEQLTNTLYPTTQRTELYDSSSDLSDLSPTSSRLPDLPESVASTSVISASITSLVSSPFISTVISPTSSSFVASETVDGSPVYASVTPGSTTTTSTLPDTSGEASTNTTSPDERSQTRVLITFTGNCHLLRDNFLLQEEFIKAWVEDVESRTGLEIDTDNAKMEKVLCDPFKVIVHLIVNDSSMLSSAQQDVVSSRFHVRIPDSVRKLNFSSTRVVILDDIKVTDGSDDMSVGGHFEVADLVIIGVASFLFVVLVVMLCVVLCRECYIRKRSSSFNLSDIPHISLKLSDFTLTKIPRPKVFYRENSTRKADRVPMTRVDPMSRHVSNVPDVEDHYDKLNINADKIQVRMRDHAHGLVVGVMSSKHARGNANESSISDGSVRSDELSKKSLLSQDKCISCLGVNNPTFSNYDEEVNGNSKYTVREEIEHFL